MFLSTFLIYAADAPARETLNKVVAKISEAIDDTVSMIRITRNVVESSHNCPGDWACGPDRKKQLIEIAQQVSMATQPAVSSLPHLIRTLAVLLTLNSTDAHSYNGECRGSLPHF